MRALQMGPVSGAPQAWARHCFFMYASALLLQTCLYVAIPGVLGGSAKPGKTEGDMFCIYIGFTCSI